jgi:uncharacterized protein YndB with AHSA1/START domain
MKSEISLSMINRFDAFLSRKNRYSFNNFWTIQAPPELIWEELINYKKWPLWCEGLKKIEQKDENAGLGKGNHIRSVWKGALPYTIAFDAVVKAYAPCSFLSFTVSGDLCGDGTCRFLPVSDTVCVTEAVRDTTRVNFVWDVSPGKFWMRMGSAFARPVFIENHNYILDRAVTGFTRRIAEKISGTVPGDPVHV